jgi:hypothetical protein
MSVTIACDMLLESVGKYMNSIDGTAAVSEEGEPFGIFQNLLRGLVLGITHICLIESTSEKLETFVDIFADSVR